jgi:hypothetical protein
MEINVKTITGKPMAFPGNDKERISDLKLKISQKLNFPISSLKLSQNSKELENQQLLCEIDAKQPLILITLKKEKEKSNQELQNEIIEKISEMGFEKEEVVNCLKASHFNEELAVVYLTKGIPKREGKQRYKITSTEMRIIQQFGASAEIDDLRECFRNSSDCVDNVIFGFKKHNEALFKIFSRYPDLLTTILTGNKMNTENSLDESCLSEEDTKIVEILKQFGFEESECIQAYFLCQKNPEQTVNYLFDQK